MKRFLIITVFMALPVTAAGQQSAVRLKIDYQEGRISRHDYIVNMGYAAFAPERLAPEYKVLNEPPEKCALEVITLLRAEFANLTPAEQLFFQQFLLRPSLPESYVSPEGLFKIHYSTAPGSNQVPLEDIKYEPGIPDFVEEAAITFDRVHRFYIDTLGYQPPPSDAADGSEYDVFMMSIGSVNYGWTAPEGDRPGTSWYDPASYIVISNDFTGSGLFTHGLDALRVTAAHEYHHAIQFGYVFRFSDVYFYEMTSTWFEDVLYDEVNDYFQYLWELFGDDSDPFNPVSNGFDKSFTNTAGLFKYGMSIWFHFLAKRFGPDVVRSMWEQLYLQTAITTIEKVINEKLPTTFETELQAFYTWNYFAGSRADTVNYYTDGKLYPDLVFNEIIDTISDTTITINNTYLSSKYVAVKRQLATTFTVHLDALSNEWDLWRASAVLSDNFMQPTVQPIPFLDSERGNLTITSYGNNPELVIIPTMTSKTAQPGNYQLTIELLFSGPAAITKNKLLPSIPNPANFNEVSSIKIPFVLVDPAEIEIKIFSLNGALVKSFPKRRYLPGLHENEIIWDGRDENNELVPSGIYFYIMNGEGFTHNEKMAIIR